MVPLGIAIILRMKVRAALDSGDDAALRRWCRVADSAIASLSMPDVVAYMNWAGDEQIKPCINDDVLATETT